VISKTARIGSGCYIGPFAVVGDRCTIGDNTIIYDRVSIVQDCKVGNNCIIRSGAVIGSDGFAFERLENGGLVRFPHQRGVIVGNNVEICSNTSVCRGSLSDTVIADGTKIDALVHVGHNAQIGKNCLLTAGSIIGGSARIGDSSWMGLNCIIKQKVRIGNNVVIAAQACVLHDVCDRDVVAGVPARSIRDKVTTDLVYLMAGQRANITASSSSITRISPGFMEASRNMQTAAFLRNLYSADI
jgi:UDP-3-O-[3-hydroxymyristoyl] glucosamine N-acyltransferase